MLRNLIFNQNEEINRKIKAAPKLLLIGGSREKDLCSRGEVEIVNLIVRFLSRHALDFPAGRAAKASYFVISNAGIDQQVTDPVEGFSKKKISAHPDHFFLICLSGFAAKLSGDSEGFTARGLKNKVRSSD